MSTKPLDRFPIEDVRLRRALGTISGNLVPYTGGTGNVNLGLYNIIAQQLISTAITGTPPLVVASTTLVSYLNADFLDNQHMPTYTTPISVTAGASPVVSLAGLTTLGTATYLVRVNAAGTGWEYINPATVVGGPYLALAGGTMTGAISLGAFQLTSTVATGTAPFVVASTTLVANLHAANSDALGDKIIGTSGNKVPLLDGANTFSAAQTIVGDLTVGANDSTTRSLIIKASNAQYFEGICNTGTAYFSTVGISLAFQSATSVDIKSGRVGSTNYAVDINYGPSSSTGPLRFWGAGSSTAVWSCTSGGDVIGAGTCSASGFKVGSTAGIDATVALAKLTPVTGTNGSLTITKGIITAYVAPT